MHDFIDAIMFGFKEMLRVRTMKYAMVSGIIVSFIWVGIGIYFWNDIITLSSSVLSLLPFSMLRSNGAWMLSTFLWLQLVLVTFALVFAFFGNIFIGKMSREKYSFFSIFIGIASAVFWSVVWVFKADYIHAQFLKLLTWLPFETVEKGIAFLIGFYLIYTAIIVSMIFITSITSTKFLAEVREECFPYDRMYDDHEISTIAQAMRDTTIFLFASLISFPFLFVPIINFIILVALWVWLMKDTIVSDASAFVFGDIDKKRLQEYQVGIWSISIIGSLFNFMPVLNVFGPYFTELAMFHYLKDKREY